MVHEVTNSMPRMVRLSELFTGPDRAVVIYHFMYGKKNTKPCPMCTLVINGDWYADLSYGTKVNAAHR